MMISHLRHSGFSYSLPCNTSMQYQSIQLCVCIFIYSLLQVTILQAPTHTPMCTHTRVLLEHTNIFNANSRWIHSSIQIIVSHIFMTACHPEPPIGPAVRVFTNGPGDLGSIPGRVIPKTLKMVLDTTLLNTQRYKVRFKGKVEQSWEWSSALPYTLV